MADDYDDEWLLPEDHPFLAERTGGRTPEPEGRRFHFCFACGTPWRQTEIQCPACGGMDRALQEARPHLEVPGDAKSFPGPWAIVPWPRQGTVVLFGGPGTGKSSLAGLLRPTLWITREQEPKPVGAMFRRLMNDDYMPKVVYAESAQDVEDHLQITTDGPVVLDSLTAFGLKDGMIAAKMIVDWARERNDRCLAIGQVNKGEQIAGYNTIPHLFDAVISVTPDPWGVRAFRVTKSRWSPLGASYWRFNKAGQIDVPDFPAAYSVEGNAGNYWLHPYPMKGATWNGLLASASNDQKLQPGSASAAVVASYMPSGFVEPNDVHERQRFALRHGLSWLSPTDFKKD